MGRNTLINKLVDDYDSLVKDFASLYFILQDVLGYPVTEEGVDKAILAERRGAKVSTILRILEENKDKDGGRI